MIKKSKTWTNLEIHLQFKNFYLKRLLSPYLSPIEGTQWYLSQCPIDESPCICSTMIVANLVLVGDVPAVYSNHKQRSKCRGFHALAKAAPLDTLLGAIAKDSLFKSLVYDVGSVNHHHNPLLRHNNSYIPTALVTTSIGQGCYCWCYFSALTRSTGSVDLKGSWPDSRLVRKRVT